MTQSAQLSLQSFEDFEIGREMISSAHTITEAEVMAFARLSGDHNPLHTDESYAARGPFKRRVAQGLLTLAITSGLAAQLGVMGEAVLAFREVSCKFRMPVFIGDSLYARLKVVETRPMPRVGGGLVGVEVKLYNQDEKVVQSGIWTILVQSQSDRSVAR